MSAMSLVCDTNTGLCIQSVFLACTLPHMALQLVRLSKVKLQGHNVELHANGVAT